MTGARLSLSSHPILHFNQTLHACSDPPRQREILIIRTQWLSRVPWYILNSSILNKKLPQWHWHLIRSTTGSAHKELETHHSVLTSKKLNRLKNRSTILLGSVRAGRTRCKLLLPKWKRQTNKHRESLLTRAETGEWKPPLEGRKTWSVIDELPEAKWEWVWGLKTPGGSSHRGTYNIVKGFLQELDQVPRVNTEEKSPCASWRRRGKETMLKYTTAFCS